MLMILPQPRAAMRGPNRWPSRNGAVRLTAMVRFQSSSVSSSSAGRGLTPAALTRMSGSPNGAAACSAALATPARSPRSSRSQSLAGLNRHQDPNAAAGSAGGPVTGTCRRRFARLSLPQHRAEDLDGPGRVLAMGGDLVHDVQVVIDVVALVEIHRVGQMLEVDDVCQLPVGKPQDAERADHGRMRPRAE